MTDKEITKMAKNYSVDIVGNLPQCYDESDFRQFTQSLQYSVENTIEEVIRTVESSQSAEIERLQGIIERAKKIASVHGSTDYQNIWLILSEAKKGGE